MKKYSQFVLEKWAFGAEKMTIFYDQKTFLKICFFSLKNETGVENQSWVKLKKEQKMKMPACHLGSHGSQL